MRRSVTLLLWIILAFGLGSLLAPQAAVAADDDSQASSAPLLTVSFSGYDALMKDLQWVGKLGNDPGMAKFIDGKLKEALKVKDFTGLDKTRPWGVVLDVTGSSPFEMKFPFQAFVPATDLKALLAALEPAFGKAKESGEGVFELTSGGNTVYVKQVDGGWAVVSTDQEQLKKVPADPVKALGGLPAKYTVAFRLSLQHRIIREVLLPLVEMGMQQAGGEQQEVGKQMLAQMKAALADLDALTIGLGTNPKDGVAFLEYSITAKAGTKTAKQFAQSAETTTDFAGFLMPGAAVTLNFVSLINKEDVPQVKMAIDNARANALKELEAQGLAGDELKQAQQLIGDLMDVLVKTVESGKFDGGLCVKLEPKAATLLAGGYVADGAQVDKVVKQFVALLTKEDPNAAKAIKLDAESYQGVKFHTLSVPVEMLGIAGEDKEKWVQVFGPSLDVVLGVANKSIWFAAGRDPAKGIKSAIDASRKDAGKQVPPFQLSIAATPVANFVAAVGDEEGKQGAAMVTKIISQSPGKDQAQLVGSVIENGMKVRLEIQEGLVRLIGSARKLAGAGDEGTQE